MAEWCMRIACWIPKATNALSICNTIAFPQQWLHERALYFILPEGDLHESNV